MSHWLTALSLGGRLVALEPLRPAHARELAAITGDARIWAALSFDLRDPATLERWLNEAEAAERAGQALPFALRRQADGRLIGSTRYMNAAPSHRRLEIGWTWFTPACWGGPFNVDVKLTMLRHAFESLGAQRVEFRTDRLNERSQAAIRALGAVQDGLFHRHMVMPGGRVRDTVQFALLDEDWSRIKPALEARLAAKLAAMV